MLRRFRQPSDGVKQILPPQCTSLLQSFPLNEFCNQRTAGHRGNASLGQEACLKDLAAFHLEAQPQNIATRRILHLRSGIGVRNFPRVSRMLELIQHLSGVHQPYSNQVIQARSLTPDSEAATLERMPSDHTPHRVVSLQPSATVILSAIGKLDRLVACTRYCVDLCPEVAGRTILADSWTAKESEIVSTHPDLVIAAVPYQEQAVSEILKSGARFLGLAPRTLNDIYGDIASIAGIMGVHRRGEDVIGSMQSEIEAIRKLTRDMPRPRVFCEEWGKPIIASQPWVAELVDTAGGEFVGTPAAHRSSDDLLAEDPDVFVAAWCGAGDRVPLNKIITDRGWQQMRAVIEQRVFCVRDDFLNTPAPTLLHGLRALAKALHPDRFPQAAGLRWIGESHSIQTGT